MTAYGIFGDVDASPKLVRATLSDLLEAHRRSTPDEEFWLNVGVRTTGVKVYDEILDWAAHNGVYTEVVTPSSECTTFVEPAKTTVTPAFMLTIVDAMRHAQGGKILALVGNQTPARDVLQALAKAKDNGTEIRDLAEAALTLILFRGDDPPPDSKEETPMSDDEEYEATYTELGEYADNEDEDPETAHEAQRVLTDDARKAGINPDEYETWAEVAALLEEDDTGGDEDGEEGDEEEEPEPEEEGELTREQLVGKDIGEIKALAKAAGIEGYSKMRREALIKALLGEEDEEPAPAPPAKKAPAKKAAAPAKKAPPRATQLPAESPGEDDGALSGLTDDDVSRIADAVVQRLHDALHDAVG